jgi:hypothetical protein
MERLLLCDSPSRVFVHQEGDLNNDILSDFIHLKPASADCSGSKIRDPDTTQR